MNPQVSEPSDKTVTISTIEQALETKPTEEIKEVTDRELAVVFMTFRKPNQFYKSNGKTIFKFCLADVKDLLYKWQHNEPIPVSDIRDVFNAQKSFNSAVRD